jgi:CBS domain-containing protein
MRRDVPVVRSDARLGEVLDAVTSTRLQRAIVVGADGRVLGVVSDGDLLARLDAGEQTGLMAALMGRGQLGTQIHTSAANVMRTPALSVPADTPVADAARRMLEARHKVLAVTDAEGRLLGAVDRADLLRHMVGGGAAPSAG